MRITILILALLVAGNATAQTQFRDEPPPGTPDFSKDTLLRLFAENPERDDIESRFEHRFGAISFRTGKLRWRVGYLPFLMPLHGSQPWDHNQRWPDPFILTGTEIATTPRSFRERRSMNSELRRIDRKLRESAVVRVEPD